MERICIVGAFDFTRKDTGGQPVKTRELYDALTAHYGEKRVVTVETRQWKKHILRMLYQLLRNVPRSDRIIMLPAHNGLKVFSRLLQLLKKREARLFYDVIGGWLPQMAKKDPKLIQNLQKLDGIWVETTSMKIALNRLGLERVCVVPNFKSLPLLKPEQLQSQTTAPFKLVTFSRVMEEKGITDAILAVHHANAQLEKKTFALDIYGPVAEQYAQKFAQLQEEYADFVCYRGVADPDKSVQILKDYFALLFPTKFYTEGIPGTIIDAYAAGVPVVTVRWLNYADVFEDGVTGLGYSFGKPEELEQLLLHIAQQPEMWLEMKKNCLRKAKQYMPKQTVERITEMLEK